MVRLIDADMLMPNAEYKGKYDTVNAYDIVNCPTVDAEIVRHGHWINKTVCSICGEWEDFNDGYRQYCPNCGAKMDESIERKEDDGNLISNRKCLECLNAQNITGLRLNCSDCWTR